MEEVRSQQRGGMGAQEGGPGLVAVRRWRDPMSPQDLADGGGGYPVPEPRSSPWILTTPQRRFSRASRKIRATSSSGSGGRPGGLGCRRHFAAAWRRCQPAAYLWSLSGTTAAPSAGPGRARQAPPGRSKTSAAWDSPGAAPRPRAAARVSPRPWMRRTAPATQARTPRSPAAGKPARRTRAPIMAASKSQVKPVADSRPAQAYCRYDPARYAVPHRE